MSPQSLDVPACSALGGRPYGPPGFRLRREVTNPAAGVPGAN